MHMCKQEKITVFQLFILYFAHLFVTIARCAPASYSRSEIKITVFQLFILYFAHLFVTLHEYLPICPK